MHELLVAARSCRLRRAGVALLLGVCSAGCSHLARLGVGPAAVRPGDGKASYGDELRLRAAAGTSDGGALSGVELEGRLLVTERSQALSLGVGPTYLHWLGPAALLLSLTPALGGEYFDRTVLATAGLRGGLGLGLSLSETTDRSLGSMGWAPFGVPDEERYLRVVRNRTLLTLELTGATDVRSRGASFAAGLLVGLAWSDERYTEKAPPLSGPWFFRPVTPD